ncbi:LamG domain-containing protein [Verrucomicrobiota bacterium sgz303538]
MNARLFLAIFGCSALVAFADEGILKSLDEENARYGQIQREVESQVGAPLKGLLKEYSEKLEEVASKALSQGTGPIAVAALREQAAVKELIESDKPVQPEQVSRLFQRADGEVTPAPFEILTLQQAFAKRVQEASDAQRTRLQEIAKDHQTRLEILAGQLEKAGDRSGAERVWSEVSMGNLTVWTRGAISSGGIKHLGPVGGEGGGRYEDVAPGGGVLVGFRIRSGDFAGHHVITGLQPVFRNMRGVHLGAVHGPEGELPEKEEAREGYAVGGWRLHHGGRVDGFEVIFMRIAGNRLDPKDSYTGRWWGGKGGGGPTELIAGGLPVVGVFGGSGEELDSLGLIAAVGNLQDRLAVHLPLTESIEERANKLAVETRGAVKIREQAAWFESDASALVLPHIALNEKPFSVALWAKLDGEAGTYGILQQRDGNRSKPNAHFHLMLKEGSRPYFGFFLNDLVGGEPITPDLGWVHLVFQYTGERQEIWRNGLLESSREAGPYLGDEGETRIGDAPHWSNVPAKPWKGALRDIRIYQRALTPDEIAFLASQKSLAP